MIIRTEPKDVFMYSVYLIFDPTEPDAEDHNVHEYLERNFLEPKRVESIVYDDRNCEMMYFGGCYIGRHMDALINLQTMAVQREMVAAEIGQTVAKVLKPSDPRLDDVIDQLTESVRQSDGFKTTEDGQLLFTIDVDYLHSKALDLATKTRVK